LTQRTAEIARVKYMTGVLLTSSTAGLGWSAARQLIEDGHEVVLHARNSARLGGAADLVGRAAGVVVGDLASADETRNVADQDWRHEAVIHNAAVYVDPQRVGVAPPPC
jgi:NAD(P)-dependent dehydrogenase (short-subunit alcohol dehydrogenase family)